MKNQKFILGIFFLGLILSGQEITRETLVINIEVPVRVFKGTNFVENLTIDDFDVYEDGKLQRLEAVYLIKKKNIERKEEKKKFDPDTSRTFYLIFEITEYSPKIDEALYYFIQNALLPNDIMVIVTPMRTYEMHPKALKLKSKEEIVDELRGLIRKDAMIGSSEYRSELSELTKITRALAATFAGGEGQKLDQFSVSEYADMEADVKIEMLITNYRNVLQRLENVRYIDQSRLLDFARTLKNKEGQKYVFLFYQREFIPQIEPRILTQTLGMLQDKQHIIQDVQNLSHSFKREITFDVDRVKRTYADSSISIHFMFFTKPADHVPGLLFEEHSEDVYSAFREMAAATGGITESSSNPFFLFYSALESSENFYLLYYSPLNYRKDGKFHNIEVKVKNLDYKVIHRAGYFAN